MTPCPAPVCDDCGHERGKHYSGDGPCLHGLASPWEWNLRPVCPCRRFVDRVGAALVELERLLRR